MHFALCPRQGNKIEGVTLNGMCILGFFSPKQGQRLYTGLITGIIYHWYYTTT